MSSNQKTELKLIEIYDQKLDDFLGKALEDKGKDSLQHFLKEGQRKIDIFEKQVLNFKQSFPDNQDIQLYEARKYFFQGVLKMYSGIYYDWYSSLFSPSSYGEFYKAIDFFDTALQIHELLKARSLKVHCYRWVDDKKNALQELDYILKYYADDEEAYIKARMEKDELESPPSSGIGNFFRSIFK